jgi:uncharacterized iron-regulated membrane protein
MKLLALVHRWTGGLLGLLLAVLGLSGTLLLYEDAWLHATVPHAADPHRADTGSVAAAVSRLLADPGPPSSIVLAGEGHGLHRLYYGRSEAGAYADQSGEVVARWDGKWERTEVWLFDLHHHLLTGETGETLAGVAGLAGLFFVVSGVILWWRSRRTFRLRVWPSSLSRAAIIRHHRDLGTVVTPVLFVSLLTGAMMTLKPVSDLILSPLTAPADMRAATRPPDIRGGPLAEGLDWSAMLSTARDRFPGAELRVVALPREPGGLISLRLRQPAEWLPNGRTMAWFEPSTGALVEVRDALALPVGNRVSNTVYPVHAAKVGGVLYTALMTVAGIALTLLGTLAVFSFWIAKADRPRRTRRPVTPVVQR